MFSENLKTLRKNKGFSQEQLSVRLNVVRQTISKWEKNLSVPDAEMLMKIAEVLDVSVNDLLGGGIVTKQESDSLDSVASELAKLNELLAAQQSQQAETRKKAKNIIGVILILLFMAAIYGQWNDMWHEFGQNLYHLFN
ncbi:MAG: helix-turn-helix transcriptional regulator [Clostridia bacterium]|nr:helix-turn-helix transcriptional regulator [Clostridia bacterium]